MGSSIEQLSYYSIDSNGKVLVGDLAETLAVSLGREWMLRILGDRS